VGFNTAEAGTGVHASVPAGPVIDGRGWWCWRCLYSHISRESRPTRSKAESGPGKTEYEPVAHLARSPDSAPNSPFASLIGRGKGDNPVDCSKAQISGLCCSAATSKRMSALGQKRTSESDRIMSALPKKQTLISAAVMSALCQKQTFNHVVEKLSELCGRRQSASCGF